jgi:hypothetical protein
MARRRTYPKPFVPANNQWSQGLCFFTVLDTPWEPKNFVRPGHGSQQGVSFSSLAHSINGTAGYTGQNFLVVSHDFINWDQNAMPSLLGPVTVVGRWIPQSGAIGAMFGTWNNNEGFGFNFIDGTFGPEDGIEMIVGRSGSNLIISSGSHASFRNIEATVGGRYNDVTRTVDVWQNGVKLATNTDTGKAWNSVATVSMQTGTLAGTSQWFNGGIFWIAVFNRCLSDSEMAVWTTKDPIDLLLGNKRVLAPILPGLEITNVDIDFNTFGFTGPILLTLGNSDFVDAAVGGTLNSDSTGTFVLQNTDLDTNQLILQAPILMPLANIDIDFSAIDLENPFALANVDTDHSAFSTSVAGSANELAAGRYRR